MRRLGGEIWGRARGHKALSGAAWSSYPASGVSIEALWPRSTRTSARLDLGPHALRQLPQRHRPEVAVPVVAHRRRLGVPLAIADHEHVRGAGELRVPDLLPHGLGAGVDP